MRRKATAAGCILWIIGLGMTIAGLNLDGDPGRWISVTGNILFLIGLGITGAVWLSGRKKEDEEKENTAAE